MTVAPERLCPFLSALEPAVCVGDKCQLWIVQRREYEDGRREDFSNCAVNVLAVTAMRQLIEQIRTTATVDGVKETFMQAPAAILSAMVRQRILPT